MRERSVDYLEYGRCSSIVDSSKLDDSICVLSSRNERNGLATREDLVNALADSKITIAMTRLDNQPEIAEGGEGGSGVTPSAFGVAIREFMPPWGTLR